MKKRNIIQSARLLRFGISLLLAVALLVVYRSSSERLDSLDVTGISQNPAAADVRVQFQESELKDVSAKWGNGVSAPVMLAPDRRPPDSAAAVLQIRNLPSGAKLYVYSGPAQEQRYKPLPAVLYGFLMLAFGVTGFFSITPVNRRVNVKNIFTGRPQLKSK